MARELVASDDFNRASLGANWAQLNSGIGGDITITLGSVARGGAVGVAGSQARWIGAGSFTNDQYAGVEIVNLANLTSDYWAGVCVRASADTDANRDFYMARVFSDSAGPNYTVALTRVVNGTAQLLHSASIPFAVGDRIELEVETTELRVCKNGLPLGGLFTQTDVNLTSGQPGIVSASNSSTNGTLDNFQAGNLVATPAATVTPNRLSRSMAISNVAIVNDALVMLGADRISSLTQANNKNAAVMNAVFERVLEACLRRHPWSFAVERASVAADAAETLWGGLNKFPKPADFVRLIRDDETGVRPDWKIEGTFIVTTYAAPLEFKYIKKVTNPTEFDPLFAEYLAVALAVRTCKAITGSTSQADALRAELKRVTMEARQVNAFEHDPERGLEDDWVLARL